MPNKKLTLGAILCVVLTTTVLAQQKTYTVRSGDTVSEIAAKTGSSQSALLRANGLSENSRLKIGRKLVVPGASKSKPRTSAGRAGGLTVREGDNDVRIAKRLGVTTGQLRAANPGVNWRRLQIGQALVAPGSASRTVASRAAAPVARSSGAKGYVSARAGDNDWIIARRIGTKAVVIRALNPSIDWSRLQIGQPVRVPVQGGVVAQRPAAPSGGRYAKIAGDDVTVRAEPNRRSDAIASVDRGKQVSIIDREGEWSRVRFASGTTGWVRSDFLSGAPRPSNLVRRTPRTRVASANHRRTRLEAGRPTRVAMAPLPPSATSADRVLRKAETFRGVRYRYGAMSRSGTDCSGFTTQVFRANGIRLPRTSRDQANVGKPVATSQLKKGDLVFFRTRGRRISHVGIYIGGGKFIHASSGKGRVRVDTLQEGYYRNRFATARRVLKADPKKALAKSSPKASTKPVVPVAEKAAASAPTPAPAVEGEGGGGI